MARASVTHVILFIAIVSAATGVVGVALTDVTEYAQSVERAGDRDRAAIDAEIAIVDDPEAGTTYDERTETVTTHVKNVGGSTLEPTALDVLVDGEYLEPASLRVLEADHWRVGRVLEVTLEPDGGLAPGDHRALVRVDGAEAVLAFEHRRAFWLDDGEEADVVTVDLNETDGLTLGVGTDPAQAGESIGYELNDTTVATFASGDGDDTASGTTDAGGTDDVTLALRETGTVRATLDAGWDDAEVLVRVENSSQE